MRGADALLISVDNNQVTIAMDLETSDDLNSWITRGNVSTTIPPGETMAISFSKTSGSVQLVSRKYEIITIQDI